MDAETLTDELRSYGVSVESVGIDDHVEMTYMTAFPGETVHEREIGRVCNALIELAEDDRWDPTRVDATVERAPGDVLGTWRLDPAWIERLLGDDISETDFSMYVLETVEHDPAHGSNRPSTESGQ